MKRAFRLTVWLGFLALLGGTVAGYWGWQQIHTPYRDYAGAVQTLHIPKGTSATEILSRLERHGVVRDATLARLYLIYALREPPLQAGEYLFETALTVPQVLDKMIRGDVVLHSLTLLEGLTLEETAASLTQQGFGDEDRFLRAMRSSDSIADLDSQAIDLEGYLFPDTYHLAAGTSEAEIVATLVATFRKKTAGLLGGSTTNTIRELVTLASIVEKEAQLDDERPVIAGVYTNRLRIGMALYADPTIIFALKRLGRWDGNLRRPDLKLDSPYNTYVHAGLPPGPICSPGAASLQAAAYPAENSYLYFVSRNDGTHVFAASLAEHNRNVQRWQRDYWRQRWAKERAQRRATQP